jgi:hypothetical protein
MQLYYILERVCLYEIRWQQLGEPTCGLIVRKTILSSTHQSLISRFDTLMSNKDEIFFSVGDNVLICSETFVVTSSISKPRWLENSVS